MMPETGVLQQVLRQGLVRMLKTRNSWQPQSCASHYEPVLISHSSYMHVSCKGL